MPLEPFGHLLYKRTECQEFLHGRDLPVFDAAGMDEREVFRFGGHIESEAVHGHPILYAQADCSNLFLIDPNPHMLGIPTGLYGEIPQGSDHHLF